jgi:type IX secretion system PorP/SprF family membrane protein
MPISKLIIRTDGSQYREILLYRFSPVVLFILVGLAFTCAQPASKNYQVQFSQFMVSYPMVNPSAIGLHADHEILTGYQRPVTGFTGISTYYCSISFVPYRLKLQAKSRNLVGLRFYNDNEGAYINRMRFYGMYAFHTRINSRLNFAGGIDFGGMNFAVKATPSTEGASVFKVDANTGIWIYNKRFHVGFSVNQLFNSVFQPIDERTVLPTHFNLTAAYAVVANDDIELSPHILITYPYYSTASIQAGLYSLLFGKIIAVVAWNRKTSIAMMAGVGDVSVFNSKLNVLLSYSTGIRKAALGISKLELTALYSF